jgi:hypothetical protein
MNLLNLMVNKIVIFQLEGFAAGFFKLPAGGCQDILLKLDCFFWDCLVHCLECPKVIQFYQWGLRWVKKAKPRW